MPRHFKQQSTLHIGIIMDGNGRWAIARNLPRSAGHAAGVETVRRIAEAASGAGARTLTLFAFSSDNWKRPTAEVDALMQLLCLYLDAETETALREHTRLQIIGRRCRCKPVNARAVFPR
jgi:undecaprenyl diphosphate synthase